MKESLYTDTLVRTLRLDRKDIWYLHFVFEAYDGLGTVSSINSREGIVEVRIPASREEEGNSLLGELSREIRMEEFTQ